MFRQILLFHKDQGEYSRTSESNGLLQGGVNNPYRIVINGVINLTFMALQMGHSRKKHLYEWIHGPHLLARRGCSSLRRVRKKNPPKSPRGWNIEIWNGPQNWGNRSWVFGGFFYLWETHPASTSHPASTKKTSPSFNNILTGFFVCVCLGLRSFLSIQLSILHTKTREAANSNPITFLFKTDLLRKKI